DQLGMSGGLLVAALVGHADEAVAVCDIEPLRIRAGRVERHAEGLVQSAHKDLATRQRAAARGQVVHTYIVRLRFSDEEITVGSYTNDARGLQARRDHLDEKAGRHARLRPGASWYHVRPIRC